MELFKLWFSIFTIGLVFYPLTASILKKFNDKGWLFSKIIGISISSWLIWLLSYLKILPYTKLNCYIFIILFALINYGIFLKFNIKKLKEHLNLKFIKNILISELIFIICLSFWTYIKGFSPEIDYYTEDFMDYGYMNSLMNSKYMPTEDIWFSGNKINYYYFGQYISGYICNISGITASQGYNLIIALIAALTFVLPCSIGYNLFKDKFNSKNSKAKIIIPIIVSLLIGLSTSLAGSLHYPLYKWFSFENTNYTYVDETRYIGYKPDTNDKTATEVPVYSAIVGNLHAHYIDLIFSLTMLALLVQFFVQIENSEKNKYKSFNYYARFAIIALILGIQKMTNYWDFPIYFVIIAITIIAKNLLCNKFNKKSITETIFLLFGIILLEELFTLPFNLDLYISSTKVYFTGIMSPLYKLLVKWGLPVLCAISFLIIFLINFKRTANTKKGIFKEYLNNNLPDLYIIILSFCAIGLIILPEIIYLKDIYGDEFKRFNTMFKLTYQAFLLFSICTNYILAKICISKMKTINYIAFFLLIINLTTSAYGVDAILTTSKKTNYKGISKASTESYIQNSLPYDYRAIEWIRENIEKDKIILECTNLGNSYSNSSRISTFTGNPTVLGWSYHEWIWRANQDHSMPKEVKNRTEDIKTVYTSTNISNIKDIINKYNISYIYIGEVEFKTYENINIDFLKTLGDTIYEYGNTYIIKVK